MKNLRGRIIYIVFCLLFFVLIPKSFAGEQNLDKLEFDINIGSDCSMQVTEVWHIDVRDTNTLFKTFKYNSNLFEDVKVTEIENGVPKNFEKINKLMYHVTPNCFYSMKNDDGLFEIAWGANVEGREDKIYKIEYKVKDAVKIYQDCAELYWQFVGQDFSIYADSVVGNITVPEGIENIEDLRVWAHGPLNGNIQKISNNTVKFEVENLPTSNFLEVRIATPTNIFETEMKHINTPKLAQIIEEETRWAEKANKERDIAKRQEKILKVGSIAVSILLTLFIANKTKKAEEKLSETPKQAPVRDWDYFREIPDENATPAEAAFLYYFKLTGPVEKVISATMLDLALKGAISFEVNPNNKKEVTVYINEKECDLKQDEVAILNFLKKIPKEENKFTMKEFERYAEKNPTRITSLLTILPREGKENNIENQNFDKELEKEGNRYSGNVFLGIFACFISAMMCVYTKIAILPLICAVYFAFINARLLSRINGLTQKGIDKREEWKSLKKYMEDFSMLNEREVPDLILWEKYLVYATAFGIAEKVLKQLKIRYPELQNEDYFDSNYAIINVMTHTNISKSFEAPISRSVMASSNYSSGSGGGGGFSGGGGGRSWWWRRWRSLKYKRKVQVEILEFFVLKNQIYRKNEKSRVKKTYKKKW